MSQGTEGKEVLGEVTPLIPGQLQNDTDIDHKTSPWQITNVGKQSSGLSQPEAELNIPTQEKTDQRSLQNVAQNIRESSDQVIIMNEEAVSSEELVIDQDAAVELLKMGSMEANVQELITGIKQMGEFTSSLGPDVESILSFFIDNCSQLQDFLNKIKKFESLDKSFRLFELTQYWIRSVQDLQNTLEQYESQKSEDDTKIQDLAQQIDFLKKKNEGITSLLQRVNAVLSEKNSLLDDKKFLIQSKEETLEKCNKTIGSLEYQLTELEKRIEELTDENRKLARDIKAKEYTYNRYKIDTSEKNSIFKDVLRQKDNLINALEIIREKLRFYCGEQTKNLEDLLSRIFAAKMVDGWLIYDKKKYTKKEASLQKSYQKALLEKVDKDWQIPEFTDKVTFHAKEDLALLPKDKRTALIAKKGNLLLEGSKYMFNEHESILKRIFDVFGKIIEGVSREDEFRLLRGEMKLFSKLLPEHNVNKNGIEIKIAFQGSSPQVRFSHEDEICLIPWALGKKLRMYVLNQIHSLNKEISFNYLETNDMALREIAELEQMGIEVLYKEETDKGGNVTERSFLIKGDFDDQCIEISEEKMKKKDPSKLSKIEARKEVLELRIKLEEARKLHLQKSSAAAELQELLNRTRNEFGKVKKIAKVHKLKNQEIINSQRLTVKTSEMIVFRNSQQKDARMLSLIFENLQASQTDHVTKTNIQLLLSDSQNPSLQKEIFAAEKNIQFAENVFGFLAEEKEWEMMYTFTCIMVKYFEAMNSYRKRLILFKDTCESVYSEEFLVNIEDTFVELLKDAVIHPGFRTVLVDYMTEIQEIFRKLENKWKAWKNVKILRENIENFCSVFKIDRSKDTFEISKKDQEIFKKNQDLQYAWEFLSRECMEVLIDKLKYDPYVLKQNVSTKRMENKLIIERKSMISFWKISISGGTEVESVNDDLNGYEDDIDKLLKIIPLIKEEEPIPDPAFMKDEKLERYHSVVDFSKKFFEFVESKILEQLDHAQIFGLEKMLLLRQLVKLNILELNREALFPKMSDRKKNKYVSNCLNLIQGIRLLNVDNQNEKTFFTKIADDLYKSFLSHIVSKDTFRVFLNKLLEMGLISEFEDVENKLQKIDELRTQYYARSARREMFAKNSDVTQVNQETENMEKIRKQVEIPLFSPERNPKSESSLETSKLKCPLDYVLKDLLPSLQIQKNKYKT